LGALVVAAVLLVHSDRTPTLVVAVGYLALQSRSGVVRLAHLPQVACLVRQELQVEGLVGVPTRHLVLEINRPLRVPRIHHIKPTKRKSQVEMQQTITRLSLLCRPTKDSL
jgi:hypothetical protein